ncbi:class II fructose-bisphosphate aldolase [Candidatus Erwinia haradaeae]|uniref:Fructose-bisphosphate aldolase n=1 Tax=Candidatus Erwinia haradaeae TaxID=1922217 RepID=A0A803FTI4_9GAMM|nr:class II fructose-bisphosphate aldolase [Candidatus Erwinia haradaeae]VFP88029.1 Fructose-bisphosphate aldolase class 2 [Candidatus Erwinia haradaeae]
MSNILDFVKPGVITGQDVQTVFKIAKENRFAIPAINCIDTNSINAVLETASKVQAPVIIQFSYNGSRFIAGKQLELKPPHIPAILGAVSGAKHTHLMAKYYGIPVILHTDHCSEELLPWIDGLLEEGESYFLKTGNPLFSSHMIDLSSETIEKNIEISSQYLSRMKKINMTLEIELGCTGGEEDGIDNSHMDMSKLYTRPIDVNYAYTLLNPISTNFTIAASFGNAHGVYQPGKITLNPVILRDSQNFVMTKHNLSHNPLNLVFHGGSGSSSGEIKEAIQFGVVKVNIDTDMQWASWDGVLQYYKKNRCSMQTQLGNHWGNDKPNKKFYDPRVWLRESQVSMVNRLEYYFQQLNAINVL